MPHFEFGISLASLLPHTVDSWIFHGSPKWVARELIDRAGYRFLQTLPLRGVTGDEWFTGPEWSWYKEDAWNAVNSFFQAALRRPGESGRASKIHDWLLFPKVDECNQVFRKLAGRAVTHHFAEGSRSRLVEINPEMGLTPAEIAQKAWAEGFGVCLDTEHLIRDHYDGKLQPFGQTVEERVQAVDTIAPWVQLVHLKGTDGVHAEIVRRLLTSPRLQSRIDVVAEFMPNIRINEHRAIEHARQFLASAKRLFQI